MYAFGGLYRRSFDLLGYPQSHVQHRWCLIRDRPAADVTAALSCRWQQLQQLAQQAQWPERRCYPCVPKKSRYRRRDHVMLLPWQR